MTALWVMLAGGLGTVARFWLDSVLSARLKRPFSWAIPLINVSGSFVLGVLAAFAASDSGLSTVLAVVGVGFLGGYTTFSTASVDAWRLARAESGGILFALLYAGGTVVASVAAAVLGLWLGGLA